MEFKGEKELNTTCPCAQWPIKFCLNSLWVILKFEQRLGKKYLAISNMQSHFSWSFIIPLLNIFSDGAGRDQKDFGTWENITMVITFGLWHYMKHMAHLQNLKQLRVTWGANAIPKEKARLRGQRIILVSHVYILVAVPAGFPPGLLQDVWKKWLLVNLRQFLWLMIPLNHKKSTLVFLLNLCLFPALLLQ